MTKGIIRLLGLWFMCHLLHAQLGFATDTVVNTAPAVVVEEEAHDAAYDADDEGGEEMRDVSGAANARPANRPTHVYHRNPNSTKPVIISLSVLASVLMFGVIGLGAATAELANKLNNQNCTNTTATNLSASNHSNYTLSGADYEWLLKNATLLMSLCQDAFNRSTI